MEQISLFDLNCNEHKKIKKPIRLIELFAGVGSQAMALRNIGVKFDNYKVIEFDKYAVCSYNAIHNTNFSPMDITKTTAKDLEIKETDKYEYIVTYSYPCFTKDSLVLTKKGYKNIDKILPGDYVLTHDNSYKKVEKIFDNGIKDVYEIKAMGVDCIKSTLNHKFYTREMYRYGHKSERFFKNPEWKQLKDLTKKDYLGVAINTNSIIPKWDGINFDWKDGRKTRYKNELSQYMSNPDFWWFVGRWIGDGWFRKQGGIVLCCGKHEDKEVEHKLNCLFKYYKVEDKTVFKYHIPKKEFGLFFRQFGNGAKNKHLTNTILDLPVNLLKSFLEGYISADGYISKEKITASSISRELIYGIAQCVSKVYKRPYSIYKTKRPKTHIIEGRTVNQKESYSISYKLNKNKQDKAFYEYGYIWYPINEISYFGKENVYDIQVESNHSYTVQNTIVHNCTDLSKAGKMEGMGKGSGTRSGLLWEFERILDECKELPQILLMENVTEVHSKNNIKDFNLWCQKLESLGYHNFYKDMNAKNYGIPQNRNRCFMISLLGDYYYSFPSEKELKLRVKDFLEEKVDEKYYIGNDMKKYIVGSNEKWTGNNDKSLINKSIASTTNTGEGSRRCDASNYICYEVEENYDIKLLQVGNLVGKPYDKMHECGKRVYDSKGLCQTINTCGGGNLETKIIEQTLLLDEQNKTIKNDNYVGTIMTDGSSPNHNNRIIEKKEFVIVKNQGKDIVKTTDVDCTLLARDYKGPGNQETNEVIVDDKYVVNKEHRTYENRPTNISGRKGLKVLEPIIYDDYNSRIKADQNTIGTLTTNIGQSSKRNGTKLIELSERFFNQAIDTFNSNECSEGDIINAFNCNLEKDGISPTITTRPEGFKTAILPVVKNNNDICTTSIDNVDLRIRKLTPMECWRLMGFSDEDFYKAKKSLNDTFYKGKDRSNSQLYKQSGNSIVVNVLEEIFKQLF